MVKEITPQRLLDVFWENKVNFNVFRQINSRGMRVLRFDSQDGTGHLIYDLDAQCVVACRKDDWYELLNRQKD